MNRLYNLKVEKIGSVLWRLTEPLVYHYKGYVFYLPKGFITDGASNIRLLWSLCPPMSGKTAEPAVLHDWLYSKDCNLGITREKADEIFLEAMEYEGVSWIRRHAVYRGVRIGGGSSFRKCYSKEKVKEEKDDT